MIDLKDSPYFNTLPKHIQESIQQSAIDFNTEADLKTFADNLSSTK